MKFRVIPECFYRESGVPKEKTGFPLRSAAGMARYDVGTILRPFITLFLRLFQRTGLLSQRDRGEIVEEKKAENWIFFNHA
jgi:hypothetical protein